MLLRVALAGAVLLGCESGYDVAPTPCDDWCQATQRAGCADDWPHECVGSCTYLGYNVAVSAGCEAQWWELVACFREAPDDGFVCEAGLSVPRVGVCALERSRLGRCIYPVWQSCSEACVTLEISCAGFDERSCLNWCGALPQSCLEAVTYHDCLIENAESCDLLAPECAESRALAVLCPAELVPEGAPEP